MKPMYQFEQYLRNTIVGTDKIIQVKFNSSKNFSLRVKKFTTLRNSSQATVQLQGIAKSF